MARWRGSPKIENARGSSRFVRHPSLHEFLVAHQYHLCSFYRNDEHCSGWRDFNRVSSKLHCLAILRQISTTSDISLIFSKFSCVLREFKNPYVHPGVVRIRRWHRYYFTNILMPTAFDLIPNIVRTGIFWTKDRQNRQKRNILLW